MDQCHIRMCHTTVAWTSDVTFVRAIGLGELRDDPDGFAFVTGGIKPALIIEIPTKIHLRGISGTAMPQKIPVLNPVCVLNHHGWMLSSIS